MSEDTKTPESGEDNTPLCNAFAGFIPQELLEQAKNNNWLTENATKLYRNSKHHVFDGKDVLIYEGSVEYVWNSVMIRDVQSIFMIVEKDGFNIALRCIKDDLAAQQAADAAEHEIEQQAVNKP